MGIARRQRPGSAITETSVLLYAICPCSQGCARNVLNRAAMCSRQVNNAGHRVWFGGLSLVMVQACGRQSVHTPDSARATPVTVTTYEFRDMFPELAGGRWCRRRDLNPRPTHYECVALPAELLRHTLHASCFGADGLSHTSQDAILTRSIAKARTIVPPFRFCKGLVVEIFRKDALWLPVISCWTVMER